ncbi:MAG: hypothetical protein ABIH21_02910 [Patescibacteria group bacterium]
MHYRYSVFPLIIALLTIVLAVFMALTLSHYQYSFNHAGQFLNQKSKSFPDPELYKEQVINIIVSLESVGKNAESLDDYSSAVDSAVDQLLELKVPSKYKDLHLKLVTGFNQIKNGINGEEGALEKGQEVLNSLSARNNWLQ